MLRQRTPSAFHPESNDIQRHKAACRQTGPPTQSLVLWPFFAVSQDLRLPVGIWGPLSWLQSVQNPKAEAREPSSPAHPVTSAVLSGL